MGLRDKVKAAQEAAVDAASKRTQTAKEQLEQRSVDVNGVTTTMGERARSVAGTTRDIAIKGAAAVQDGAVQSRGRIADSGLDVDAFSAAAMDGVGVTNRHGDVKAWRVARVALRPMKTTRVVAKSVAREALSQRRALLAIGRASDAPGVDEFVSLELDEAFFAELVDWIIVDSGIEDSDQNRAQVLVYLTGSGIDTFASEVLVTDQLSSYEASVQGQALDPAQRTASLLRLAPASQPDLLRRLEALRQGAIDAGRRNGRMNLVASPCCGAALVFDEAAGTLRCERCQS